MSAPNYIERGGEQVFSPPYVAEGVQFFGFAVQADMNALQTICDKYLNGPSGSQSFTPLSPYVMFVFNKIDKMYAQNPPDSNRGWYSEQEAAVWMPVWDQDRQIALWHHPYMVVDSSYAMAMGREIYGFPKEMGWLGIADGPDAPASLRVETVVAPQLSAGVQATQQRLFEARIVGAGALTPDPPFLEIAGIAELFEAIIEMLALKGSVPAERLAAMTSAPIPFVFLKQIRDAVDMGRVCFQSTQEAICQMTNLIAPPRIYLVPYEIAYDDWGSHPIAADLGLPPGSVQVALAFWTKFDFEIGFCQEISRYP